MNRLALVGAVVVSLSACGGKTDGTRATTVASGGMGLGGETAWVTVALPPDAGAGVGPEMGGSGSIGGASASPGAGVSGVISPSSPTKQRWIVALQALEPSSGTLPSGGAGSYRGASASMPHGTGGDKLAAEVVLLKEDHTVEVSPLPPYDTPGEAVIGTPGFSLTGKKFCYTSSNGKLSRVWVASLSDSKVDVREVPLPADAPQVEYYCAQWTSETQFSVIPLRTASTPADPMSSPFDAKPVRLSTEVNGIPDNTPAPSGESSPRGGKVVIATADPSDPRKTNAVVKLNGLDGRRSDPILTLTNVDRWFWSADDKRLFVVSGSESETPELSYPDQPLALLSIDAYEFSEQLEVRALRHWGPLVSPTIAWVSPTGRFLAFQAEELIEGATDCRLYDLDSGAEMPLPTGTLDTSAFWISTDQLISMGTTLKRTTLSASAIAKGELSVEVLSDQNGPITNPELVGRVSESKFVIKEGGGTKRTLLLLTLGDSVTTSELLVGPWGRADYLMSIPIRSDVPDLSARSISGLDSGAWQMSYQPSECLNLMAVTQPSYFYLDFYRGTLRRTFALQESLNAEYDVNPFPLLPGGAGFLARSNATREYVWVFLDQDAPGPIVKIPLARPTAYTTFHVANTCQSP